jgi:FkbM family methyltransferase
MLAKSRVFSVRLSSDVSPAALVRDVAVVLAQAPDRLKLSRRPLDVGERRRLKANGFVPARSSTGSVDRRLDRARPSDLSVSRVPDGGGESDKRAGLEAIASRLGAGVRVKMALLGPEARADVPFYAMEAGSSVLPEDTGFDRKMLALRMTTLDEVVGASTLQGPVLLKVDVQGYELEVLRGGARTLALAEVVLLEVSLLEYNLARL